MFGRGLGDTYAVFLVPLEREFGWSRAQVTGVYSTYLLVNGLTAPAVGHLFDRLGPRWVYAGGMACLGSAFFLAGFLSELWQFYVLIGALVGLGVSLNGMVPGAALLARWYRARLSTAIGIAFSAVGVGTIVFVPLAQFLVQQFDWRFAYRAIGAVLLLLLPVVAWGVPWRRLAAGDPAIHGAQAKAAAPGATLAQALRSPLYWALAAVFFCTASGIFSVTVQLVAFFIEAGIPSLTAATAYGVVGMLSAFSVMSSGLLADRFGIRQTLTASYAGSALGVLVLLALAASPSMFLLMLFVPVFGLCLGMRGPIISSICARAFAGPRVATIYGTIYSANAIGAGFGAWLGGALHDLTGGYGAGLAVSLAFLAAAATPFWVVPALRNFR